VSLALLRIAARRWALTATAATAVVIAMAACFVPDQYEAEIRFTKTGGYGITYIGVLTNAPLFSEIARGNVTEAKAAESIKGYIGQLKRDSSFKEVASIGRGRFQVRYSREGRFFGEHQMVTFVSRQAPIFRLRTFEDGRISISGSGAGRQYAERLEEVGLATQGLFRVVTDAEVTEHNAQFVRQSPVPGFTVYDWRIRSFRDAPPRLIAKLVVDPKTGGAPVNVERDTGEKDDADLDALARKAQGRK
jgi:hypothetical protein